MYYLVDVEIFRTHDSSGSEYEKIQRLVKSEDKNTAWDLMEKYLNDVYISEWTGTEVKYNIHVNDTIFEK
jgi:hypothetical protein